MDGNEKIELARRIAAAAPRVRGSSKLGRIPADQLALVLLLEADEPRTVGEIRDGLGIPQACASELVARAKRDGRVFTWRSGRLTFVHRTPKAVRERESARDQL